MVKLDAPDSPNWVFRAPDVPGVLDCVNGALSCQHSSVDRPLAAATVVMFRCDGTGRVPGRVKADSMAQGGGKSKLSGGSNEQLGGGERREQNILIVPRTKLVPQLAVFVCYRVCGRECQDPTLPTLGR